MKKNSLFFAIFFLCIAALFAQQEETKEKGKEKTVEEEYLESIEIQIINTRARAIERSEKISALDAIEKIVEEERVSSKNEAQLVAVLSGLAGEGTNNIQRSRGRVINNFPIIRARACVLLGKIGGKAAGSALVNILLSENNPTVLADCVFALGSENVEVDSATIRAIAYVIKSHDILHPDNTFALYAIKALEKIAEKNQGIKEFEVYVALIQITQGMYINKVKIAANNLLEKLGEYEDS